MFLHLISNEEFIKRQYENKKKNTYMQKYKLNTFMVEGKGVLITKFLISYVKTF